MVVHTFVLTKTKKMFKFILEAVAFAAIILSAVLFFRWLAKPEPKSSGVESLDHLGEEVDESVKQFEETKQKVAEAEEKVKEMKGKTEK